MKGYIFTYGVDGFGADIAPAYEEGCYLDFDKAFNHLIELNHKEYVKRNSEASEYNWKEFILNEQEFNYNQIYNDPYFGMYSIEEIEIIK